MIVIHQDSADRTRDVSGDRIVVFVQRRTAHEGSRVGDSIWRKFSTRGLVGHVRRRAPQQRLHSGLLGGPGAAVDAVQGTDELEAVSGRHAPDAEKLTATTEVDIMGAAAHGRTPFITPQR